MDAGGRGVYGLGRGEMVGSLGRYYQGGNSWGEKMSTWAWWLLTAILTFHAYTIVCDWSMRHIHYLWTELITATVIVIEIWLLYKTVSAFVLFQVLG